jgi:hypothetical protein
VSDHPLGAVYAGVFLFIVGVAIGVSILEINRRERDRLQGWLRADGTVVALFAGANGTRPQVAFTAANGERVSFTLQQSAARQFVIGERLPVLYRAEEPGAARVDPRTARWTRNALAAGAALVLMALGAYVAWYARQWDARRQTAVE